MFRHATINKLDREGRDPIDVLDEIENILNIQCAPITWPIGMGKNFKGIFHLLNDSVHIFEPHSSEVSETIKGLDNPRLDELFGDLVEEFREEIELVRGASYEFDLDKFLAGELSPTFFGSAMNNFGITELMDSFIDYAPKPQSRETKTRVVEAKEEAFSGFVFKIQANISQV